jgi:glycosyltransferase involved in cell wall biosynthesis
MRQYPENMIHRKREKNPVPQLLWAGRMLPWKHPDDAVWLADQLKTEGYRFRLTMVGEGEKYQATERLIKKYGVSDCVTMAGSKTTNELRDLMECADVFLFTSDSNEGWGAVLNEAMNSGCAVVACKAAGAAPYLVHSGTNGLIYCHNRRKQLLSQVRSLLDQPERIPQYGEKAMETICNAWNAESAVRNFDVIVNQLLRGEVETQISGNEPCQKA